MCTVVTWTGDALADLDSMAFVLGDGHSVSYSLFNWLLFDLRCATESDVLQGKKREGHTVLGICLVARFCWGN